MVMKDIECLGLLAFSSSSGEAWQNLVEKQGERVHCF